MTTPAPSPRIIAVGGGKGGIGKSLCSASLAIALGRAGKTVVAVDADLGGANLHTCLGMPPPKRTLSDFISHDVESLSDVLIPSPAPNVSVVAGSLEFLEQNNPTHSQKQRVLRHLVKLPADYIILDLGAGTQANTMDFFLLAEHGLLVVVPEPTSVENAYKFLKAAYMRRFRTVQRVYDVGPLIERVVKERGPSSIKSPQDLVNAVRLEDREAGDALDAEMRRMRLRLLINQMREPGDAKVGDQIRLACQRYFGVRMDVLGGIPHDEAAWRAVRARQPLMLEAPQSPAALAFGQAAAKILELDAQEAALA